MDCLDSSQETGDLDKKKKIKNLYILFKAQNYRYPAYMVQMLLLGLLIEGELKWDND